MAQKPLRDEVLPASNQNKKPNTTTKPNTRKKDPLSIPALPGATQDFSSSGQELRMKPVLISFLLYHKHKPVHTHKNGKY